MIRIVKTPAASDGNAYKVLPSLTSLRFFAAALVVLVHLQVVWPTATILQRGDVGVSFFYILSGFILTWVARPPLALGSYYRRRFARIYPVHIFTWISAVIIYPLLGKSDSAIGLIFSLFLIQAWVPTSSVAFAANGVAWSLSVEVLFYVLFPFAIRVLTRCRTRMISVVCVVALIANFSIAGLSPRLGLIYIFPPSRLPEFTIGICLSLLIKRGWRLAIPFSVTAAASLISVAIVFTPLIPDRWSFSAITLLPFALLIVTAAQADIDGSAAARGAALIKLGEWSFALFMTHQIILVAFASVPLTGSWRLALLPIVLGICVLTSALVFQLLETPMNSLLSGRRRQRNMDRS
jgi:peptidoglycan/LPS O-acetylase OafA/YrhL